LLLGTLTLICIENCFSQKINPEELRTSLDQFRSRADMKGAIVSLSIRDTESKKLEFSYNDELLMIPASIQKLISSSTAKHFLGSDYTFKTYLESDGLIENGTLKGNLYIRGTGDPTLGSSRDMNSGKLSSGTSSIIADWLKIIQSKGIHKIDGGIYADNGLIDEKPAVSKWLWEDVGNYYGSGIHGLSYNENLYHITFNTLGSVGSVAEVSNVNPKPIGLKLINEITLASKNTGDNAYVYGGPYSVTQTIKGTLPVGQPEYTIKAALPDPGYYLSQVLTKAIMKKGVMVSSPSSTCYNSPENCCSVSDRENVIHMEESISLDQIIKLCHLKSINTYSEAMLKAVGTKTENLGTTEAGIGAMKKYLNELGLDTEFIHLFDGSGLSRVNAISSSDFSSFLANSYKSSGDISNTLRENGKLKYKTGYMERVRSHAGYFTKEGKTYSYSFIINNYSGSATDVRKEMEKILASFL